jgi:hypothetical protein
MTKALEDAIHEIARMPETDQEKIGRGLLSHIEKLRSLRDAIDPAIASLNRGGGRPLDAETFIRNARQEHGGA